MAPVLERLELDQPTFVTSGDLARILEEEGVRTSVRVVAARLRARGWLLSTDRRGVWEFAPAAVAGPFSRHDPQAPLQAFLLQHPDARCGLTFQAAAWAHGIADRVPARLEVAASDSAVARQLPRSLSTSVFAPRLGTVTLRAVPVLAAESVLVHMAARPSAVRSWESATEWLAGLAAECSWPALSAELRGRPATVTARTGYLLEGMRPDLAASLRQLSPPKDKTWFGPRRPLLRHDSTWLIADTLLPFDPRTLEPFA
jgi:predicted transcriptional regulator of viral defense system